MEKGQAAVEYLMLLATALIIVAIAIKYIRQTAEEAGKSINESTKKLVEYVNESIENATRE